MVCSYFAAQRIRRTIIDRRTIEIFKLLSEGCSLIISDLFIYCLCVNRKLEHQMQAQQLKISEEKRLVAEIDILKRSKRNLKYVFSMFYKFCCSCVS